MRSLTLKDQLADKFVTQKEVLKGVLYFVGTRELAGKEPDMGLWASIEQGIAALKVLLVQLLANGDEAQSLELSLINSNHPSLRSRRGILLFYSHRLLGKTLEKSLAADTVKLVTASTKPEAELHKS